MQAGRYGIVAVVALAPVPLLVSPMSHMMVQEWVRQANKHIQPPDISCNLPTQLPMKPGIVGKWSPRLHFYLQDKPMDNATFYVEQVHPLFASKFVDEF